MVVQRCRTCPRIYWRVHGTIAMRTCGTRGVHARYRSFTRQHSGQRHVSCRVVNQVSSDALVDVCKGTQRGQSTSAQDKERILQLVEELAASQVDRKQTGQALSATWKLIWTTEKVSLQKLCAVSFSVCLI